MCLYVGCTRTCSLLPPSFPFFPSPASPLYPFSHGLWLLTRLMSGWTLCFWERCLRKGCPSHSGTSSPSDDTQPLAVWCCHRGSWRRHHATAVLKMEISGSFTVEIAATPCLGFTSETCDEMEGDWQVLTWLQSTKKSFPLLPSFQDRWWMGMTEPTARYLLVCQGPRGASDSGGRWWII